jgi:hypothetical protein
MAVSFPQIPREADRCRRGAVTSGGVLRRIESLELRKFLVFSLERKGASLRGHFVTTCPVIMSDPLTVDEREAGAE